MCRTSRRRTYQFQESCVGKDAATAVVLAPFFAHLEILFKFGYRPQLHHDIKNSIGVEIARIRRLEAEKRRAKAKTQ